MSTSLFSSNNNKIDFIYPFSGDIKSFDPQIAKTADEFLLVENCFEGLVRVNDNGKVQAGVAKTWEISNGGKTYTFHLRQGAKWNVKSTSQSSDNKELTKAQELMGESFNPDITANDFVFALQRACEKNTDAPLFSSISNIVNASKIHSGKLSSNKLGVKALDDYTLEINLKSADDGFLNVLATAVAMPCNKEYFNATKGRYGLGLDYTIFNGQFYVSNILEASYILKNNKQYVGDFKSAVTDITLKITDFYWSTDKNEFGFRKCPHTSYKVDITAIDDNDNAVPEGEVTVYDKKTGKAVDITLKNGNKQSCVKLNDKGKQSIYLQNGSYTVKVTKGREKGEGSLSVGNRKTSKKITVQGEVSWT